MRQASLAKYRSYQFPVFVEKDKDGFYVVECPLFRGCYAQGKTLDKALKNIKEVIGLCLEEKENREILESTKVNELSLLTLNV